MKKTVCVLVLIVVFSMVGFCSKNEVIEKPIYITDVNLEGIPKEVIIGDKIPFDIDVLPKNNTEAGYSFYLRIGSDSQIIFENNQYYLCPTKTGRNSLLVKTESGRSAEVEFWVRSPIDGIDIWIDDLEEENNRYQLYVGQGINIQYNFDIKSNYKSYDVLYDDIEWLVSNNLIARFNDNTRNYLIGRQQGVVKVTAKSEDGDYTDDILIQVKSPIQTFNIKSNQVNSLYIEKEIELDLTLKDDLIYDLDKQELQTPVSYTVTKQWIDSKIIISEIEYEKEQLSNTMNSGDRRNHLERLSMLEIVLKRIDDDGYCDLPTSLNLKDRYNQLYKVARISGNKIIGYYPGKVRLIGELEGTSMSDMNIITFNGIVDPQVIYNVGGYVVLTGRDVSELEYGQEFMKLAKEQFNSKQMNDIPCRSYILSNMQLSEILELPSKYYEDFRRVLVESDLIELRELMRDGEATYDQLLKWQIYIDTTENITLEVALNQIHEIMQNK